MSTPLLIQTITQKLSNASHLHGDPTQVAWWLLEALTHRTQAELITQDRLALSTTQQVQLDTWLDAIITDHKPLQYVLGTVPFLDLELQIRPPILIPRPETEQWCLDLITQLKEINAPLRILDLCTGSGCIGLALAHALPRAQVVGIDINPEAITLAQENAAHNKIQNITFVQSDLFSAIAPDAQFDLIVSNPPYVTADEWKALDPHVREWEDPDALVADDHGLALIKQIIETAQSFINKDGPLAKTLIPQLVIEIGSQQGTAVATHMEQCGYDAVAIKKDHAGHERVVTGHMPR